jgi:hypothetical protein
MLPRRETRKRLPPFFILAGISTPVDQPNPFPGNHLCEKKGRYLFGGISPFEHVMRPRE